MTYPEMAKRLDGLNLAVQAAEDNFKELKAEREAFVQEMTAQMLKDDMPAFVYAGKTYSVTQHTKWASVRGEKRQELYEVLRKYGYGDIITETINANTLCAAVEVWVENNGGKLPDYLNGLVTHEQETKISIRRK